MCDMMSSKKEDFLMIFQNLDRIVFAGDSVTDMGSAQPVGEGLFDNVGRSYSKSCGIDELY